MNLFPRVKTPLFNISVHALVPKIMLFFSLSKIELIYSKL